MTASIPPPICTFLLARLAEDELWAREASRADECDIPVGAHWQWADYKTDDVLGPDPGGDPYLQTAGDGVGRVYLSSVEEFQTISGLLPQFLIAYAAEVRAGAAGHIVRHDPARVLAEVAAKRAVIAQYEAACGVVRERSSAESWKAGRIEQGALMDVLLQLAAVYSGHLEYREEWRS